MLIPDIIDGIRSILDGRPTSIGAEVFALEYAAHCREVNERLAKIALMLEGGGEIQALQLAEQNPRVLDVALALSFGREAAWQSYCLDHGHEVPSLVEARTVEMLLEIQTKGLSSNHPLYKEYRTAVSSRDDERAYGLIQLITRLNPGDENAVKELKRLRRKGLQAALSALRASLGGLDDDVLAAMTRVEEVGTAEEYEQGPEWNQAQLVLRRVRKAAALTRMPEALALAKEALKEGAWRQSAALHGEFLILADTYGLADDQAELSQQSDIIAVKLAKCRAEAERAANVRQLIAELQQIADDVEARSVTPHGLTLDFAAPLAEELARKLKQLDVLQGTLSGNERARVNAAMGQLIQAVERCHRSKRVRIVSIAALAIIAMLSAGAAGALYYRAMSQAELLVSLRSQQSTSAVRELVTRIRQNEPLILRFSRLSAELAAASQWLENMDASVALAERELASMDDARRQDFVKLSSPDLFQKLKQIEELVAALPADRAIECATRLGLIRDDGERELTKRQAEGDRQALKLAAHWNEIVQAINLSGPVADAERAVEPAKDELAPLMELAAHDQPILKLPASTEAIVNDVSEKVQRLRERIDACATALKAVAAAETTSSYQDAIAKLGGCGFSEGAAAQWIVDAWPDEERIKAFLVFRGNLIALKTAGNDSYGNTPVPEVVTADDRKIIRELTDETLSNLWSVEWKDATGKQLRCLSIGRLAGDADGGWSGKSAKFPRFPGDPLKFNQIVFDPRYGHIVLSNKPTATSELISRLKLERLLDDTGTKFRSTVLPLLDWVSNDPSANPLAKAYIWGRLVRLVENHKPEEWGLHYCPGLIDEIKAFHELERKWPLSEFAWLLESPPSHSKDWKDYYSTLGSRSSYDEQQKTQLAATAVLKGTMVLAGHIGIDGKPIVSRAKGRQLLVGLCNKADDTIQLEVSGIADPESEFIPRSSVAPLSPLWSIDLPEQSQEFLLSIHKKPAPDQRPQP